jgi:tripartite-type tricarboxylate transporter receptor subunit TctC
MHFVGVALGQATGVQLTHVPYRGTGPTTLALLAGEIPAATLPYALLMEHVKAGKMRVIAHSGSNRAALAPDVPTFKELGYPQLEISSWYVIIAPAKMPAEILARYNEIFNNALRVPAVRDRMRKMDLEIHEMTPAQLAATLKSDYERWGPVVKASGFTATSQ